MKFFKDRTWLIILGVAVAILVTLTTLSWNEPASASSGNGVASPSTNRAVLPKIANELSRHLIKPLFRSR